MVTDWRKSTHSVNGASCVELSNTLDAIRDSKNPEGPVLRSDVRALIRAVRRPRFRAPR
ncbi:DUF397 domain-containing protein [Actinokineospora fastidiosa]|uniref:DUF397 domain-containing protein n=1 Tax=Actinokineospora fastidiosa TaxID=1816 RepID=A0A918LGF2_9PSEU|nr:DUF397 domain-containing protein [Actinokineospora fastidiosa]GGS43264.1 hypothetical protein GCM10010171_42960 [Actinokineospora fastidiosa]